MSRPRLRAERELVAMTLPSWSSRRRDMVVGSLLVASFLISYIGAFGLKLGAHPTEWSPWFGRGLGVVLLVKGAFFVLLGVHRGMWRYAGLGDLVRTVEASLASAVVLGVVALVAPAPPWLVPVVVLDLILSILVLSGVRVAPRLLMEFDARASDRRRVIVIGAGDAGEAVVRELKRSAARTLCPVAFVDDDASKRGKSIHGVPVEGNLSELAEVVARTDAQALIVAICGLPTERLREIRAMARATGLPVKKVPALEELLTGRAGIAELRDFTLEELLEREPIRTDRAVVDELVRGRTVLVTGAAGSIGSELSRQILRHGPRTLVLLDANENALFEIENELVPRSGETRCVPVLCNIRDDRRLGEVFARWTPQVVFHAAAYKHVPVLEHFPEEAVRSNVLGTRNVAELAHVHGAERFVLISTDKAVRPTSVMGTTKRVAELVVTDLDRRSATQFTTIRFGNVLGSAGSVMQVFRKQIARGGPVTVTHPEMRRYFMSIPEAVELVLFAAAMDDRGSTYILDMGEQVRILDLAHHFIRLCGLEPGRDIEVAFTGLRPGEKLYEELWTEQETPEPTEHRGILRAPRHDRLAGVDLPRRVQTLVDWAEEGERERVVEHLRDLVPEYTGDPVCLRDETASPGRSESTPERPAERPEAPVRDRDEKIRPRVELHVIEGVSRTRERGDRAVAARRN